MELPRRTLRVFVSSPADTGTERAIARSAIARLARKYSALFDIEAVLWEDTPLLAYDDFQSQLLNPSDTDIVVVILWWRLGTLLPPAAYSGTLSGRAVTGTEWEFEEAFAAYQSHGKPDLLLYRKLGPPVLEWGKTGEDTLRQAQEISQQQSSLDGFMQRWLADEQIKRAHWTFPTPAVFEELINTHLEELLARQIETNSPLEKRWIEGSPYRGLKAFDLEHAEIFFGRTRARNELRDALTQKMRANQAFMLVLGASGSGKSSLVQAGLLSDLKVPGMLDQVAVFRHLIIQPATIGDGLLGGLAEALLSTNALPELGNQHYDTSRLVGLLAQSTSPEGAELLIPPLTTAMSEIHSHHSPKLSERAQVRLVIVIDQFEELFTSSRISVADRDIFAKVLAALARTGMVAVIATMRSDFLDYFDSLPELTELARNGGLYYLPSPDSAELGQIIRKPAQEAGVSFEIDPETGIGLDETIRMAAIGNTGALPLLEFVLDELWTLGSSNGALTYADYDALGGLAGAIGKRAENVVKGLEQNTQEKLPAVLRTLVTVDSDAVSRFTARSAPLPDDQDMRRLIDQLIDARLVMISADEDGVKHVRLTHESLLANWPRAQQSLVRDAQDLRTRNYLESKLSHWRETEAEGRSDRLLTGIDLEEANTILSHQRSELTTELIEFIDLSNKLARQRQRGIYFARAAFAAVTMSAILGLWFAMQSDWDRHVIVTRARLFIAGPDIPQLVSIPHGSFVMGNNYNSCDDEPKGDFCDERPAHRVTIPYAFLIGKFEVTHGEFGDYLVALGVSPDSGDFSREVFDAVISLSNTPVVNISWNDANKYTRWLGERTKTTFRLPSEAEWEYVARGKKPADAVKTMYWWGNEMKPGYAVCKTCNDSEPGAALPVGSYKPNEFGVKDMHGNVWEMLADCYHRDYEGSPKDGTAWVEKPCVEGKYVSRGGSWADEPSQLSTTIRGWIGPSLPDIYNGFRIVQEQSKRSTAE